MTMSPTKTPMTSFLSELQNGAPIPENKLAYLEQRALNNFYGAVIKKFMASDLKKSELAKRVGLSQPQINRYLASPNNWTIATVQRLLAGISAEEAFLSAEPLLDRTPQNRTVLDLLDETYSAPPPMSSPPTGGSGQVIIVKLVPVYD